MSSLGNVIMVSVEELRPHPKNRELYDRPTDNDAYKELRGDIKERGFRDEKWLKITPDRRIIAGCTRHHAAKSSGLKELPCRVFKANDPDTAELEYEMEIIRDNIQRSKTQLMKAREMRAMKEIEAKWGLRRMGRQEGAGEAGTSQDKVGRQFKVSGKTVQLTIKVLDAIEQAEADGDRRKADRLTELLNSNKITKALDVLKPKDKAKPVKKVEVPPTLHAHVQRAYSENFEACAKVKCWAEIEIIEKNIERMKADAMAAATKLGETVPPPR
jgi:hypothetical protein